MYFQKVTSKKLREENNFLLASRRSLTKIAGSGSVSVPKCHGLAAPFPPNLFPWGEHRGSQRDVVFLGWVISLSYMSPNAGEGKGLRSESQPISTALHMELK